MQHVQNNGNGSRIELIELYNFLREALLASDGGETVLACGGVQLYRSLTQRVSRRLESEKEEVNTRSNARSASPGLAVSPSSDLVTLEPHLDKIARTVSELLGNAIERAVQQSKPTCELEERSGASSRFGPQSRHAGRGPGASDYKYFVEEVLQREQRSIFIQEEESLEVTDTARDDQSDAEDLQHESDQAEEDEGASQDLLNVAADHPHDEMHVEEDADDDANDEPNDDGSDSDGDDGAVAVSDQISLRELWKVPPLVSFEGFIDTNDNSRPCTASTSVKSELASARPTIAATPELATGKFAKLVEKLFCYEDHDGIQFPKHPYRAAPLPTTPAKSKKVDPLLLLHEPPTSSEPCLPPDASTMSAYIDQAMRRREEFIIAEPTTRARLVYENTAVHGDSLGDTSCSTPNPYTIPIETNTAFVASSSLTFDSAFESGNLERAIQIGEFEYDLILRRDLNTTGHMQWFYFAVSNTARGTRSGESFPRYRFNIINLCKPDSLFNQGLRPVVYSVKDAQERRVGWRRAGEDIFYFTNPFPRPNKVLPIGDLSDSKARGPSPDNNLEGNPNVAVDPSATGSSAQPAYSGPTYFTLTFTLELANVDDTYLIAHSYPYTFTDHQRHLQHVLHQHRTARRRSPQVIKHTVLCSTISGRPCDLLTITDFSASTQDLKARRAIVLTARVHPGEAQASWIMRGIIDFLVGGSETARVLRRLFVFRVIPMLNPDGVFYGNSRCSLSACDLNRHWHAPSPQLHPTIFHAKELIRSEAATRGLVFFCDVHGHSRKKNVFMYGCDTKKRPNPRARVFAKVLATQLAAKRYISFADCSFKVSRDKETTARVVLAKELKLSWCFTLEASFAGASFGELQNTHFNTTHLRQVGSSLCETLLQASLTDVGLRERVVSLVDDHSVCLASYVDAHLVDAGIVSDANSIAQPELLPSSTSVSTAKRALAASSGLLGKPPARKDSSTQSKLRRRRRSTEDDKKANVVAASTPTAPKSVRRVLSKRGTGNSVTRRRSSPLTSSTPDEADAKLNTKGLAKGGDDENSATPMDVPARRRQSSTSNALPTKVCEGRRDLGHQPLLDLIGTFDHPDEEDTQLYKLQSIVRGSSGSSTTSSGTSTSLPSTPEAPTSTQLQQPPVHLGRRITMACAPPTRGAGDEASQVSLFGFSSRDSVPVILPPPVSDMLLSRSPKPPAKHIRFRGAGRQYSAVTPASKAVPSTEVLKSGSLASVAAVGYEPDLINASTISLKHRHSTASSLPPSESLNTTTRHHKLHSSSSSSAAAAQARVLGRLNVL